MQNLDLLRKADGRKFAEQSDSLVRLLLPIKLPNPVESGRPEGGESGLITRYHRERTDRGVSCESLSLLEFGPLQRQAALRHPTRPSIP